MITLTDAKYVDSYRIWIKFSDGRSGIVDFAEIIQKYPVAQPLADLKEFQRFYLDDWPTLAWPCGFDFSPESLYERATGQSIAWLHNHQVEELSQA